MRSARHGATVYARAREGNDQRGTQLIFLRLRDPSRDDRDGRPSSTRNLTAGGSVRRPSECHSARDPVESFWLGAKHSWVRTHGTGIPEKGRYWRVAAGAAVLAASLVLSGTLWHSNVCEAGGTDLTEFSDGEAAVFRVLVDPAFVKATAEERADAAGISRRTYFRALVDPDLEPRFRAVWRKCLRGYVGPVLSALVKSASVADARHASDRKLFLNFVGLGDGPAEDLPKPIYQYSAMSDGELVQACIDPRLPLPEGAKLRLARSGVPIPQAQAESTG